MNFAVGPRGNRLPAQARRPRSATVNAIFAAAVAAALVAAATAAQAQDTGSASKPAATKAAAAPAAKTAGQTPANQGPAKGDTTAMKAPANAKAQTSYSIGVSMGQQLHNAGITSDMVALERLTQGMRDALAGKAKMTDADQENISSMIRGARAAQGDANHAAAAAFLAENGKKKDIVTTASGLQYKVVAPGSGNSPSASDEVSVKYRGTLLDGTEFDSTAANGGKPVSFRVNGVIPGWTEALQLMKPGAKYQLFIPPKLAYDLNSPSPVIPPGSMLVFDVELLSVQPPAPAPVPRPTTQPPAQK